MRGALVDLRPLRDHPTFRRLWLGRTLSGFGGQFGGFAVVFYVWDSTHNPALVGLIGLVSAVPLVVVALLGSAFVDHVDRRRLAAGATWGLLATSLLMAVATVTTSDGKSFRIGDTEYQHLLSELPPAQSASGR